MPCPTHVLFLIRRHGLFDLALTMLNHPAYAYLLDNRLEVYAGIREDICMSALWQCHRGVFDKMAPLIPPQTIGESICLTIRNQNTTRAHLRLFLNWMMSQGIRIQDPLTNNPSIMATMVSGVWWPGVFEVMEWCVERQPATALQDLRESMESTGGSLGDLLGRVCRQGNSVNLVRRLIRMGARVPEEISFPALGRSFDMVTMLAREGVDPMAGGPSTPVVRAAIDSKNPFFVQFVLRLGLQRNDPQRLLAAAAASKPWARDVIRQETEIPHALAKARFMQHTLCRPVTVMHLPDFFTGREEERCEVARYMLEQAPNDVFEVFMGGIKVAHL
jgi:hypothetical protein